MTTRTARALVVSGCLFLPAVAGAQQALHLSRDQRTLLQAVVTAVDAAAARPATENLTWPTHVLRASDGSHYVAFSVTPPPDMPLPAGPVMLYVRLATAARGAVATTERSAIRDWLAGRRVDPKLLPGRGIAIGEMPAFGAGALSARGSTPSTGSNDLKLMAMERERMRQEQEQRDKARRAELEGKAAGNRELMPFEDFAVAASTSTADGTRLISRAFTAGPGDYDLFVAWADPAAPKSGVRVLKRALNLPPAASSELMLSSVIIADNVVPRSTPLSPTEQAAHPYTIGATEITPARDAIFTRDERLAVAFQIINARPNENGKPDLAVAFRIVRVTGDRETPIASLNPQYYSAATMPADFDLRMGHPIFAAMSAPLGTLSRGDYRLKITVTDRTATAGSSADADFRVVGTPLSLLAEAPPLGPAFRRETALEPPVLTPTIDALRPASPSPGLTRALTSATSGKLIDLLMEETLPAHELGVRAALTGLAMYSVGDASAPVHFQRALQLNASASARAPTGELRRDLAGAPGGREGGPVGAIQFLIGAARAAQGRDADAIAAWQAAIDAGMPASVVAPFLVDAYLRRGEGARAAALIAAQLAGRPAEGPWARAAAASAIAVGKDADAIAVLDARLAQQPDDREAQWLLLHALYASLVRTPEGATSANRERFTRAAQAYVAAGGVQAPLVTEWLRIIS
jgi:hypothetical protein